MKKLALNILTFPTTHYFIAATFIMAALFSVWATTLYPNPRFHPADEFPILIFLPLWIWWAFSTIITVIGTVKCFRGQEDEPV